MKLLALLLSATALLPAAESDAIALAANIRAKHMPFGTVLDPIFASPTSDQITGYTRCGDSALWTGTYLAGEAFRYKVTGSPESLDNVRAALAGLKSLTDVTGDDRLARCIVLANSPYAPGIASEEAKNTVHQAPPYIWLDNTSRDQVVGAFFGLGVAYDLVEVSDVRATVSDLTNRLLGFISNHQWSPNDDISNTFLLRPEELRMLLAVNNRANPTRPVGAPFLLAGTGLAVAVDVASLSSYFKFNLDYDSFFHLYRLQNTTENLNAYKLLRAFTAPHQNAFFNMVDRSIQGPDATRDAETRSLLDQWLLRPRRDLQQIPASRLTFCGTESCDPVPIPLRPPTDYLWQRDPFQLTGGGSGVIESAGIDYTLPYWMARYYGVIAGTITIQSAAAAENSLTADSIASLFGTLNGNQVTVTDKNGVTRNATVFYASGTQINFVVPPNTALGQATIQVGTQTAQANIQQYAPTIFTTNGQGTGPAAAIAVNAGGTQVAIPIDLSKGPVYVSLYGTGIRHRTNLSDVVVRINGLPVPVLYAGPAPGFEGLDQINIQLPPSLAGSREVIISVGLSNTVNLNIL